METLKDFLEKSEAGINFYLYARRMTLEEFWEKCERGDWMLWLYAEMYPERKNELRSAAEHCANTVRPLLKDAKILALLDHIVDRDGSVYHGLEKDAAAAYATAAGYAAAYSSNANVYVAYSAAEEENLRQTADICRKYLRITDAEL